MKQISSNTHYETKATGSDVADAFDDFMHAFEAYKQANNERLAQIENQMGEDVVTTEKMARINRSLDEQKRLVDQLTHKSQRPQLGRKGEYHDPNHLAHKSAFDAYVRKGETSGFSGLEQKSLTVGTDSEGGYLVPEQTEREIGRLLANVSPMRTISAVQKYPARPTKNLLPSPA